MGLKWGRDDGDRAACGQMDVKFDTGHTLVQSRGTESKAVVRRIRSNPERPVCRERVRMWGRPGRHISHVARG